ncbi:Hypothetical predicted protein, partial [Paramuricea clavata]
LNIYCKFCPPDMRSETPRAPEAPAQRKSFKDLKTFHARARHALFKKTPSTIAASKTMGKLTDVYPEYKYKDVYYNGGRAQNMDYNSAWQGRFDSISQNTNAGCVDVDKHCTLYASQGFCHEPFTARAMRTLCRRSCDLCQIA